MLGELCEMPESALTQPFQDGFALGEEGEVPYVMAEFAQPADRLPEWQGELDEPFCAELGASRQGMPEGRHHP